MRTSELQGAALDWAVQQCEGARKDIDFVWWTDDHYTPSTDWAQGGPIIEREKISLVRYGVAFTTTWEAYPSCDKNYIDSGPGEGGIDGPTPLIAAMRCYVASKLGDEVEIPEEV